MDFSKNIVCLDIETNDLNKDTCEILQISIVKYDSASFAIIDSFDSFIKPDKPYEIGEGAFEKHHLTKEFIEQNGVQFSLVADKILDMINDCDIITYNGNNFDIPILCRHFRQLNKTFDISQHRLIDVFKIETVIHSNKLGAVYERYTGKKLDGAHNSLCDVNATIEVFVKQLEQNDLDQIIEDNDIQIYQEFPETLIKREGNNIVFAVGKHKGETFYDVCNNDKSYIKWMWDKNIVCDSTKEKLIKNFKKNSEKNQA